MRIKQNMPNIYYVIPDLQKINFSPMLLIKHLLKGNLEEIRKNLFPTAKPVGGIKVMYQHCSLLQAQGFSATPLLMGKYHGNYFDYKVPTQTYENIKNKINDNDIIIVPEMYPQLIHKFKRGIKILFIQNWPFIYKKIDKKASPIPGSYEEYGYHYLMSCTKYLDSLLIRDRPQIRQIISNYIDHSKFTPHPSLRQENRILAMPRKNPEDLKAIVDSLGNSARKIVYADNLSESELIKEYQMADVFLATGYPEGFGLPPLEAMACGCAVVGFTGRGAAEFMIHEKTALVAEDGDTKEAAEQLLRLLNDKDLKEDLRKNGFEIARNYTEIRSKEQLHSFFKTIVSPPNLNSNI